MIGGQVREVPLRDLLVAVNTELACLGVLAERLQIALGDAWGHGGEPPGEMQTLDFLTQSLTGLSTFISALAPTLPQTWRTYPDQAAGSVLLAGLGQRLALYPSPVGQQGSGEFELL